MDGGGKGGSDELRRQGGLQVKLSKGKTKAGDELTLVEVI